VSVIPATPAFAAEYDLADLTLERRDRRGVDDHAPLAVFGLVLAHVPGLQAVEVERRDEVELDGASELVERMRLGA
jgi:hypothetical protein